MWRLPSPLETPAEMQPGWDAAPSLSVAHSDSSAATKCPLARGPPNSECAPRRHGGAGPSHSPEPTACRRTALRRGGGTA